MPLNWISDGSGEVSHAAHAPAHGTLLCWDTGDYWRWSCIQPGATAQPLNYTTAGRDGYTCIKGRTNIKEISYATKTDSYMLAVLGIPGQK